jgi:hypothetical protein
VYALLTVWYCSASLLSKAEPSRCPALPCNTQFATASHSCHFFCRTRQLRPCLTISTIPHTTLSVRASLGIEWRWSEECSRPEGPHLFPRMTSSHTTAILDQPLKHSAVVQHGTAKGGAEILTISLPSPFQSSFRLCLPRRITLSATCRRYSTGLLRFLDFRFISDFCYWRHDDFTICIWCGGAIWFHSALVIMTVTVTVRWGQRSIIFYRPLQKLWIWIFNTYLIITPKNVTFFLHIAATKLSFKRGHCIKPIVSIWSFRLSRSAGIPYSLIESQNALLCSKFKALLCYIDG